MHPLSLAAGATIEGNDLSLFYGDDIDALTVITESRRFLPKEVYQHMVWNSVICCVDILAVRVNHEKRKKECLLVLRGSEPVKGVWWLPGACCIILSQHRVKSPVL
jgi:hypothetical protein